MANSNPKGGRKGGTRFPKITLSKAVEYAKRLVSKTHTASQPADVVKPGVFDSNTWRGDLRLSGTKQFGFIEGDSKGYSASQLAKSVNSATPEELATYLQISCLKPKIFSILHNTFHNETVSTAKLKQQAQTIGVHPDSADECIETFVESLIYAGLAIKTDSDKIQIKSSDISEGATDEEDPDADTQFSKEDDDNQNDEEGKIDAGIILNQKTKKQGASNINVNIDIDPSMDPEKLEKLLKLLKGYGAI